MKYPFLYSFTVLFLGILIGLVAYIPLWTFFIIGVFLLGLGFYFAGKLNEREEEIHAEGYRSAMNKINNHLKI